jgi:hypothetical protein
MGGRHVGVLQSVAVGLFDPLSGDRKSTARSSSSKTVCQPGGVSAVAAFCLFSANVYLPTDYPMLDGRFFDQENLPSFVKINLLSPSIDLLFRAPLDSPT